MNLRSSGASLNVGVPQAEYAEKIFRERLSLAQRYVQHLAGSGIDRGLIGPREAPRLWDRHVLNCAVVAELIPESARVADVGSGAGLPGLCLALARPDCIVTLIEPLGRRVMWLQEVIADLDLNHRVSVLSERAEQVVDAVDCDVVTARAVSSLKKLLPLTLPLVHGNGQLLAIKGRSAQEEVVQAAAVVRKYRAEHPEVLTVGKFLSEPTTVVRVRVTPG